MPNKTDIKRKVASVMFTDIAGYTKLTSEDEEKAFQLIKRKRELLLPLIEKYSGRLIKEIGDGTQQDILILKMPLIAQIIFKLGQIMNLR